MQFYVWCHYVYKLNIAAVALGMVFAMSRENHSSHGFAQPVDAPTLRYIKSNKF